MKFLQALQKDIRAFIYLNILFMLYRIVFLYVFSYQLVNVTENELIMTCWYGLRISLKTAGMLTLIGALFATIPYIFFKTWPADLLRKLWHGLCIFLITLAFFARIPYYKIFNSGYNLMLFNGVEDDWHAIYITAVKQYQLYPRLLGVVIVTFILSCILYKILGMPTWKPKIHKKLAVTLAVIILVPFMYVVRFGGGYSFATSIYWENAARMKSNLLNEAILDDGQALYRTWTMLQRIENSTQVNSITLAKLKKDIKILGGNTKATTIETSFLRTAKGGYLDKQPRQVVVVFGENYALWPFLDRYKDLGLVNKGRGLLHSGEAAYIPNFLANGNGTMTSLKGLLSGLAGEGIYENYENETYKHHYATGIGNAMKKLGYKTIFWYGGFSSWQDIEKFARAQGFDEFYGAEDMTETHANAWGIPDEDLFAHISKYMSVHSSTKTFNFILTTSNHPPFGLDVDSKGFQRSKVLSKLPASISKDKETIDQLGHIWYADHTMGNFIESTQKKYPDTLFVVTGDHAERFNFAKEEDLQALSSIPCIFYGQGVCEDWFAKNATGSHMQIIPTLIEILAPKGYRYSSILPSLFADFPISFNHRLWGYGLQMGQLNSLEKAQLSDKTKKEVTTFSTAAREISVWRIKKGNAIE
ncbi:MAG: sulfatase-like hydrolase/transferase [Acidaminococcaceae bacterium]|nr:sulfatase-like hydrolase/transferase [Acidaminococcaceae bacterium]MDD4721212.1 sulfatase-like hydrolase/transferase [Acidaminococcaceae bacterium]